MCGDRSRLVDHTGDVMTRVLYGDGEGENSVGDTVLMMVRDQAS